MGAFSLFTAAAQSGHLHLAGGLAPELPEKDQRPAREQVRDLQRRDLVGVEAGGPVAHLDLVRRRGDLLKADAALDVNLDVEGVGLGRAGVEGGVGDPPLLVRIGAAAVPRPHHGRVDEGVDRVLGHEELRVVELHLDPVLGHDVGDVHGEDVGPLLLEQRGALPLLSGRLVPLACGLSLLDLGLHGPPSDAHAVDRGPRGGWEDVDRLDWNGAAVLEHLVNADPRDDACDLDLGRGLLEREALGVGASRH